jgi:hypothetical protein
MATTGNTGVDSGGGPIAAGPSSPAPSTKPRATTPVTTQPTPVSTVVIPGPVSSGPIPTVTLGNGGSSGVAAAPTLNSVAKTTPQRLQQYAAENSPIRIPYGRVAMAAAIADVIPYNGGFVLYSVWGHGPINAVESLWADEKQVGVDPSIAGITATHYTGTQVTPDALLVSAFAAQSPPITFSDVFTGLAYSVIFLPPTITTGFPQFVAILQGLKVYDPRLTYISYPGVSGSYASTPNAAANQIAGDLTCIALIDPTSYTPGGGVHRDIASKCNDATGNRSWKWELLTTGILNFQTCTDGLAGTAVNHFSTIGLNTVGVPGTPMWTKVEFVANDGAGHRTVKFFYSRDYSPFTLTGTWTQLGTTVTAAPIVLFNANTPYIVGASVLGTANYWTGKIYRAQLFAGVGLAAVLKSDCWPANAANGDASFVAPVTGELWTLSGTTVVATTPAAYSENPALAIADLQTNGTYGAGSTVGWTSVAATADACDGLVGGEKRRTVGVAIDTPQDINAWFEALRTYAGCFLARSAGALLLIPDRPTSSTWSVDESAGPPYAQVSKLRRNSKRNVPTVSVVRYTDTTVFPWRDGFAYAYAAGVQAGTVPWKSSEVALPGITRFSQAYREAVEQLNKLAERPRLRRDDDRRRLAVTVGDVITATAQVGLTAQLARIVPSRRPCWAARSSAASYDPAVYCDVVAAGPSIVDTSRTRPRCPAPTALVITETAFLEQVNGSALAGS